MSRKYRVEQRFTTGWGVVDERAIKLSKDEAKKLGMKSGPSYWAQIERFITGFNLGHYHIGKTTKFKLKTLRNIDRKAVNILRNKEISLNII